MLIAGSQVVRFEGLRWGRALSDGSVVLKCSMVAVAACRFSEGKGGRFHPF